MITKGTETFLVSVKGEVTGETWAGQFRVKTRLSHRDHLESDRVRRELIGKAGGTPDDGIEAISRIFSQLAVRVVESPAWWTDQGNGLDMADENVALDVYQQAMKAERETIEAVRKAAEGAVAELKAEQAAKA